MSADDIARLAHSEFARLPTKCKPQRRSKTLQEWVPLSAIVLQDHDGSLSCVSLATGMKCLPSAKVPLANGAVLHDCHAEVLALRAFNRFLLDQCYLSHREGTSRWVRAQDRRDEMRRCPFEIRDGVRIYMYSSEAPCGDASMELTMSEQDDATAWDLDSIEGVANGRDIPMRGRGYFSQLGIVRTKPSRADAPPSLSKSCSDKLALKQCTSLLNSVMATLIAPNNAYLHALVIPESQYCPSACERAFGSTGRFAALAEEVMRDWPLPYSFRPFEMLTTSREFEYSKRATPVGIECVASNLSAVWTPDSYEVVINGVLQGRKQFDPRGASRLSRTALWSVVANLERCISGGELEDEACQAPTYGALKNSEVLAARRQVKEGVRRSVLKPWPRNGGDEGFCRPSSRGASQPLCSASRDALLFEA